jgi:hypothetical protein
MFSVQDINAPDGRLGNRLHTWQKPDELANRLIRHGSKKGDLVVDCFACTGTFLIAAAKFDRIAKGCDISEDNLKIAKQRGLSESDSLMVNLQQQAAAEKLAATFDTIKMTVADLLAGPFSGLVNLMGILSRNSWMVYTAIGAMASISLAKTIGGLVMMAVQMGLISASAITANAAITFGVGMLVVGAAVAAGMALLSNSKKEATSDIPQMAKGGIVPASPGGTLVNVGEGGSAEAIVPLNSPKAAGMLGGGDNPGLMTAINELRNAVNALANKPQPAMAIQVGAEKLGEVVGRQAETGTNQYKNAYRLA